MPHPAYQKRIVLFYLSIILSLIACGQPTPKKNTDKSGIKNEYQFKSLSNTTMPDALKGALYIPFYTDGKYCFSNYDGDIIDDQAWSRNKAVRDRHSIKMETCIM